MHLHSWSRWQDVEVKDVVEVSPMTGPFIVLPKQVIKQQRRCSVCNLVKTRLS